MSIPEWADIQLSKDLPILRSRGENQDLEYESSFPRSDSNKIGTATIFISCCV